MAGRLSEYRPVIHLSLGSNVGDSQAYISRAIELLGNKVFNIQTAPFYRSTAVDYINQPDFLNTAIYGQTDLKPEELLDFIEQIEQKVGRTESFRWGPREIDIDIIFYDELVQETSRLTLPHPRYKLRDFVLKPLCDLHPDLKDPATGQTIAQILSKLGPAERSILNEVD